MAAAIFLHKASSDRPSKRAARVFKKPKEFVIPNATLCAVKETVGGSFAYLALPEASAQKAVE